MNGFDSYVEIQTKPNLFCSHSSLLLSPSLVVIELAIVISTGLFLPVPQQNQDFPNIFHPSLPSLVRTFYASAFLLKNKYKEVVLVY